MLAVLFEAVSVAHPSVPEPEVALDMAPSTSSPPPRAWSAARDAVVMFKGEIPHDAILVVR